MDFNYQETEEKKGRAAAYKLRSLLMNGKAPVIKQGSNLWPQ